LRIRYNLVPPTIETDASVDGGQVTLNRGQALVVRLDEDPATGQRWELRPFTSTTVIAPVQHDFVAKAGTDPTRVDAPGTAIFRVRGVAPGMQSIALDLRRPLDPTVARTVRFDVAVR
ncbi:MAG TPA: protease inhibitor I42 family protein, partial [Casimicrobiaceae bacterium]|nr:protease inhibitor I42 family protein [Casimicrobiaceae bacterium]